MKKIIDWHQKKYQIQTEDIYMLIYENEMGNSEPIDTFSTQLNNLQSIDIYEDLYVDIGNNKVRINLRPYIEYGLDIEYLYNGILESTDNGDKTALIKKLKHYNLKINQFYHHSLEYQTKYSPEYRIVTKDFITDEMKVIQTFHFLKNQKQGIIALEGKCGSGKTSLANSLKARLDITVISVDDFFLPEELKTTKRLNEIGGNIDYERIYTLLENIAENQNNIINYQKFDCQSQEYHTRTLNNNKIILLEGVYSYHPYFRKFIDKLMFLDIDTNTQHQRLQKRSNYERFVNEWIPLENKYFQKNHVRYLADIII